MVVRLARVGSPEEGGVRLGKTNMTHLFEDKENPPGKSGRPHLIVLHFTMLLKGCC